MEVSAAVSHQGLVVGKGEEDSGTDQRSRIRVSLVGVREVHLQVGDSAVFRLGGREQRAHFGRRAIRSDQQVGHDAAATGEGQLMPAAA